LGKQGVPLKGEEILAGVKLGSKTNEQVTSLQIQSKKEKGGIRAYVYYGRGSKLFGLERQFTGSIAYLYRR
jgi:hypothetical protein